MRASVALVSFLFCGCFTASSVSIRPRPALEVDGKRRAVWVSLDRSIDDVQDLYGNGRFNVEDWRYIAGQAFTDALREWRDLVVATQKRKKQSAPDANDEEAVPRARKCVAEQLPEWASASAGEKKALLERCQ